MRLLRSVTSFVPLSVLTLAFVGLTSGTATPDDGREDGHRRLRGDYGFTQTRVCVQNNLGFTTPALALLQAATSRTTTFEGVLHFDGHGAGSYAATGLQINHNTVTAAFAQPITRATFDCGVAYEVDAAGSVTVRLIACFAENTEGSGVPGTSTASDIELRGHLSRLNETLVLSDTTTEVEDFTIEETGVEFRRICSHSLTAVRRR